MKKIFVFSERPIVFWRINISFFIFIFKKFLRFILSFISVDKPRYNGHHTVTKELMYALNQSSYKIYFNPLYLYKLEIVFIIAFKNWIDHLNKDKIYLSKIIFGPNVFNSLHNQKMLQNLKCEKVFLTPSEWVNENYKIQYSDKATKFIVWPCPINVNYWKPSSEVAINKNKIIIFSKIRKEKKHKSDYEIFCKLLKKEFSSKELVIEEIKYGDYKINKWKQALNSSICVIYFTDYTESQGIALLESWSMNVPTFVRKIDKLNVDNWSWEGANSAPYLNDERGKFFCSMGTLLENINDLIKKNKYYSPRSSILDEFSQPYLYNILDKFL